MAFSYHLKQLFLSFFYAIQNTLTYSFVESLEATYPFYLVRFLGGLLFLVGMLVMAYNVWRTVAGTRTEEVAIPQTA